MKRLLYVTFVICLLVLKTPYAAAVEIPAPQNGPTETQAVLRAGTYHEMFAKAFGCDKFAWGSITPNHLGLHLEYVPEGDDVKSWTRMMTVSVYMIPKDQPQHFNAITDLGGQLTQAYGKGKIINQQLYNDPENPRIFIEYEIGQGLQKEHAAGVLMSTGDTAASFIQIQSRGGDFDEKDSEKMQSLAEGKLNLN